jgi:predicted negative regulator of RcsB-dependent stress response
MVLWLQRNQQNGPGSSLIDGLHASVNIQELLLSRVDNLPVEARETIKTAAVIGSDFRLSELATLAQKQKNDSHLPQILDQLEENQMISQAGPSAESDRHYTFQQTLVREIIYNSLSFEKRRKTHEYLAAYLEQEHRNNLEQYNDLLAYHHEKAGQWQAAGRYTLYSGHKARHRFAYPQAAGIYGRALEMFAKIPGQFKGKEVAALMALAHEGQGDMLLMSNDLTSAAYAYISAANSLTAVKVSDSLDLQIKLALTLPSQQRAKEAETILRRLLNQPLPPMSELAAAATLTWLLWRADNLEAKIWLRRTKNLAAGHPTDSWAAGISALTADLEGDYETALQAYLAFEQGSGIILTACRLGDQYLQAGNIERANQYYRQALEAATKEEESSEAAGRAGLALANYRMAEIEWQRGQVESALKRLMTAQALLTGRTTAERHIIQQTLQMIETENPAPWPAWRWQTLDDVFRISLLFHNNFDTQFPEIGI